MCLIVVAHRVSEQFPLVVAANRDELYDRPSLPAHLWEDEKVLGGRDALHGGSWLAITPARRWAAVTNLRGSVRTDQPRSRGALVTDFVTAGAGPLEYVREVGQRVAEYGGFHLMAGVAGGELVQWSGDAVALEPGVHGLSNAPAGARWPKVDTAVDAVHGALQSASADAMIDQLLRVLRTEPAHGDPTRDLFIRGDLYGTRASTVIVAGDGDIRLVEQSYGRGGLPLGDRVDLHV
ncbi:MAG TPA: NRDE family protein [Thermoanaerobaculia bacterium]|nr:NRDE family protein [Thermoanaerobaculia bacterium]